MNSSRIIWMLLILFISMNSINALSPNVIPSNFQHGITVLNGYHFYWNILNGTTLDVGIIVENCNGWVGFGISKGDMVDADIIMGRFINGTFTVHDKWANKQGLPNPTINDTLIGGEYNIIEYAGKREMNTTYMRFRRLLVTGDLFDHKIINSTLNAIFAYNKDTDDLIFHGPNAHNEKINFLNFTPVVFVPINMPMIHGIFMFLGWFCFIISGFAVARYVNKKKNSWWFPLHIFLQSMGAFCILMAFVMIIAHRINKGLAIFLLKDAGSIVHSYNGFVIVSICIIQIFLGVTADRKWRVDFERLGHPPVGKSFAERFHHYFGRTSLLLSTVNVFLGILVLPAPTYYYFLFAGWLGLWIIFVIYREYKKKHKPTDH